MTDIIEISGAPMKVVVEGESISVITAAEQGPAGIGGGGGALTSADITDFVEAAQDAVGGIFTDSATIDFNYDDTAGAISADILNNAVTYAKMQDISATNRLLGRITAGSGDTEECTIHQALDFAGATNDRLLVRQAGNWSPLVYRDSGVQALTSTLTWTGTTAPSGTANLYYWWRQLDKEVQLSIAMYYTTAGASVSAVEIAWPTDLPTPFQWTGFTGANVLVWQNHANFSNGLTSAGNPGRALIRRNAGDTDFILYGTASSGSHKVFMINLIYRVA